MISGGLLITALVMVILLIVKKGKEAFVLKTIQADNAEERLYFVIGSFFVLCTGTVSYTHLDVYKRQIFYRKWKKSICASAFDRTGSRWCSLLWIVRGVSVSHRSDEEVFEEKN